MIQTSQRVTDVLQRKEQQERTCLMNEYYNCFNFDLVKGCGRTTTQSHYTGSPHSPCRLSDKQIINQACGLRQFGHSYLNLMQSSAINNQSDFCTSLFPNQFKILSCKSIVDKNVFPAIQSIPALCSLHLKHMERHFWIFKSGKCTAMFTC